MILIRLIEKAVIALLLLIALIFALQTYSLLYNSGFELPLHDQYFTFQHYIESSFPSNVLTPENGHRPIFPAMVRVADIEFFQSSQVLTRAIGTGVMTLAWVLLLILCLRQPAASSGTLQQADRLPPPQATPSTPLRAAVIALLVTLALLWLGNARMLAHANEQLPVYGVLLGLSLAIGAQYRMRERVNVLGFCGMLLAALLATFCFGNGLVVFPTLMLLAYLLKWPWRWQLALLFSTVLSALLYSRWLPGTSQVPPINNLTTGIALVMSWLNSCVHAAWLIFAPYDDKTISYLGAQAYNSAWVGISAQYFGFAQPGTSMRVTFWLGVIGTCAALWVVLRHMRQKIQSRLQFVALALMIFSGGTACLIVLFRAQYFIDVGVGQLFADRYVPWSSLWWLGLTLYALSLKTNARWLDWIAAMAALVLAWGLSFSQFTNATWAAMVHQRLQEQGLALAYGYEDSADLLRQSTMPLEFTRRSLDLLREHKLAQFNAFKAVQTAYFPVNPTPIPGLQITEMASTDRFQTRAGGLLAGVRQFYGTLPADSLNITWQQLLVLEPLARSTGAMKTCGVATFSHAGAAPWPMGSLRIGVQAKRGVYGLIYCPELANLRLYGLDHGNHWFDLGALPNAIR